MPVLVTLAQIAPVVADTPESYQQWVQSMKQAERGPFSRIRWFCADGTVLPPTPYACRGHGGGRQHGEYNEQARTLRDNGYLIANILAALSPDEILSEEARQLKWILLERFLFESDNGWILRQARYYRGAVQAESETAAARNLLQAILEEAAYREDRFLLAREAARLLPWRTGSGALDKARSLASVIAEHDPGFTKLRNKIHSFPETDDIQRVRDYAVGVRDTGQRQRLEALADSLQKTFQLDDLAPGLRQLAGSGVASTANVWQDLASEWEQAKTPEQRLVISGRILVMLRDSLGSLPARQRLTAMELSLAAEQSAYAQGIQLASNSQERSREWHLHRLRDNLDVLYGIGFLTQREWRAQQENLTELGNPPRLVDYRAALDYLADLPAWANRRFRFFFQNQLDRLTVIEPKAANFSPDRLRGSPLLLHTRLLEALSIDAGHLSGIRHEVFGRTVALGLRSLNPGMARGTLQPLSQYRNSNFVQERPIVITSESIADLPPVAGILTAHEGNALSHVQLLARNLGIPNVVVGTDLLADIEQRVGERVVLLSSPEGVVQLSMDGPRWDSIFPDRAERPVAINVDLDKLDLGRTEPVSLAKLRATDSGRIAGPKAAKLGELKTHFPDKVSAGLVIPFGAFRQHLEQPYEQDGPSLFEWMRRNYIRLENIDSAEFRQQETTAFLRELRQRISNIELKPEFLNDLRKRMHAEFSDDGSYGVFVRSDTNVEDLPGFTGAGLNRTVPNVVGFERIIEAIKAVWASPFTERAFSWRQALMDQPEHVYAAVLLHRTVPADKSGVMVTADITNNQPGRYSIAVNEGLGGGVEGQAAESLVVDTDSGRVRLLATAAEPEMWVLPEEGGIRQVPASGAERILTEDEIKQLVDFGRSLPEHYPDLIDSDGQPAPADIEFAFADGELKLIQIRPFLQSNRAQRNRVLASLDSKLKDNINQSVDLAQPPLRDDE